MTRYERRARVRDALQLTALAVVFFIGLAILFCLEFHEPKTESAPVPVETKTVKIETVQPVVTKKAEPLAAIPDPEPVATEYAAFPEEPDLVSMGEFKITHYCPCKKCCGKSESSPWYGITATGTKATEGRTIAVDPKVIPYGTDVLVRYEDGTEHIYTAEDCGGAIKKNRIDVFMDSHQAALVEGVKHAEVYIVKE